MVPVIREGATIRVTAQSDTGTPQTVYVVRLYSMEKEHETLTKIKARRTALLADGMAETDSKLAHATQAVVREMLADVTASIENEQGPDGQPRTITDRSEIAQHFAGLPKGWSEEVVAAIVQPAAVSATLGKD